MQSILTDNLPAVKKILEAHKVKRAYAISLILKIMPDIPITNARRIVDTRNKIIHAFDRNYTGNLGLLRL